LKSIIYSIALKCGLLLGDTYMFLRTRRGGDHLLFAHQPIKDLLFFQKAVDNSETPSIALIKNHGL